MIINKKMLERIIRKDISIYFISNTNRVGFFWPLSPEAQHITGRKRDEATRYI